MKANALTVKQLTALAAIEGIDNPATTKKELLNQLSLDPAAELPESDLEAIEQYLAQAAAPVDPWDTVIAEQAKSKAIIQERIERTSIYKFEPVDAVVQITEISAPRLTETVQGAMNMVTVRGLATITSGKQVEASITTNIAWLRDYNLEVGKSVKAKVGILKDEERARQAKEMMKRTNDRIKDPAKIMKDEEALAAIPIVKLILGSTVHDIGEVLLMAKMQGSIRSLTTNASEPEVYSTRTKAPAQGNIMEGIVAKILGQAV